MDGEKGSFEKSGRVVQPTQGQEVGALVKRSLERRRRAVVYEIARKFLSTFETFSEEVGGSFSDASEIWVAIESLSQLRAQVGGRFQNIKQKWLAAGFPLREHRGDRTREANLEYDGWVELAAWIGKQGFEVRLATEGEDCLFYVKRRQEIDLERSE